MSNILDDIIRTKRAEVAERQQRTSLDALTPRTPIKREATPDRNAPCPCGSGKKYKKCCGA